MFELDKMLRSISIDDQQEIWLARTEAFWRAVPPIHGSGQLYSRRAPVRNLFQAARRS